LNDAASKALAQSMIPDCIDDAVFYLLHAIDTGALRVSFRAANGTVVDLSSEGMGELAGWFMGSNGWRLRYSRQRFFDDCADLK
jgi:hypothetical protein